MQPVIDQLPLIDYASGIRNADKFSRDLSQRLDRFIYTFLLGLLAGALLVTGLTLYIFKP